jgi:two-component system cell cycle sensor histidine kinase/response regulator CckA
MEPMLHRLIGEHIKLVIRQNTRLELVKADPGQMEQVIMNLVVNARDAMPDGGTLSIDTANTVIEETPGERTVALAAGRYVTITINDTGIGMDETTKVRIFEPFFTTKAMGKGTGLGLSTVFGIIKQSGGSIDCSSEPGNGTTFTIQLPCATENLHDDEYRKTAVISTKGNETILVAEDDELLRTATCKMLEIAGYDVVAASNGHEAIPAAKKHANPVHLLFADMIMPDMGGKRLWQHMRELYPKMKVLFTSGYSEEMTGSDKQFPKGVFFLQKPFDMGTLLRKVREVLDAEQSIDD